LADWKVGLANSGQAAEAVGRLTEKLT
jgi:hypothetical protein